LLLLLKTDLSSAKSTDCKETNKAERETTVSAVHSKENDIVERGEDARANSTALRWRMDSYIIGAIT